MHQQAGQDHRGNAAARHAQGQGGNHRRRVICIVAAFGGRHALGIALAVAVGIGVDAAGFVIADESGHRPTRTGQDTHENTDNAAADPDRDEIAQMGLHGVAGLQLEIGGLDPFLRRLLGHADGRRQGVEAGQNHDQVQPVEQFLAVEGEPLMAGNGIDADHAEKQPDTGGRQALDRVAAEKNGNRRQTENSHPEVFRRAEQQRHPHQGRREKHQRNRADHATDR